MMIYQEHDSDTWSNNGVKYKVNTILQISHKKDATHIPVSELKQQHEIDIEGEKVCGSCYGQSREINKARENHDNRVDRADISVPIVLLKDENGIKIVDGAHRVEKAIKSNLVQIPVKIITKQELELAKL